MLLVTLFSDEISLNSVSVWSAVKCQEQVVFYSGMDPDLQMGVGGGGGLKNICFRPFGPQFRLEIRRKGMGGGGGGAGPLPWIRRCLMYS